MFDLNILGAILPSQVFGHTLAQQKQGVILNISSMSAMRPMTHIYTSAARRGLDNFTRWLAVYMAQEFHRASTSTRWRRVSFAPNRTVFC